MKLCDIKKGAIAIVNLHRLSDNCNTMFSVFSSFSIGKKTAVLFIKASHRENSYYIETDKGAIGIDDTTWQTSDVDVWCHQYFDNPNNDLLLQ